MNEIARGEIKIDLIDAEAIAGLRRVDSEFDRTMRRIEHAHAKATIDADIAPLEDELRRAQRKLKMLEGEHAEVELGVRPGDAKKLAAEIKKAQLEVKSLDGMKAEIEVELRGVEKALAAEHALQKADDDRVKAAEQALRRQQQSQDRASAANLRRVNNEARVRSSLERQRQREEAMTARAAQRAHDYQTVGLAQDTAKVAQLQKQYARLTDQLEKISRQRPIGTEAHAKVELNAASVYAQMEMIKAKLNALGSHPPVDIKVDLDRKHAVAQFLARIGNSAAKISDLTVRVGPFTSTVKGLISALAFLGPTITDVLGAAGALVGVLGAGISGAAAIGTGALIGMAGAGLGLFFSLRNTRSEIKNARTAINAYQKELQRSGASSDKTKQKQQQMNATLKNISPLAREAAKGTERFFDAWDKRTGPTQKNLGRIAHDGFAALNGMIPMWTSSTNKMSKILADNLSKGFAFLGHGAGRGMLKSIFGDFNAQLPTLLHGLGAFGQGILRIGVEGARNLGLLTHGIDNLGGKLLAFTQSDSFGGTIHRWALEARDLMRFFGALTRVVTHFFGAGSHAGDGLVKSMTAALNRWDAFLTSVSGHNKVATAFDRATHGAQALWHAIAPLVGSFVVWANNLSPFVTGVMQGIGFVSKLVAKLTALTGMAGPLGALGATMGALWAVGKIGTFVSILSRIPGILRDVRAAGSLGGMLKALGSINLKSLGGGSGIVEAGKLSAAEMRAGIISGGTAAAAEFRAALAGGGAIGAAEGAASKLILPAGVAAGAGGAEAIGGTAAAAAGAEVAVGGLTVATGGLLLAGVALAGGLTYLAIKLTKHKSAVEQLTDAMSKNSGEMSANNAVVRGEGAAQTKAAQARRAGLGTIKDLRAEMAKTKKGTLEYRDLQLRLFDATQKVKNATQDGIRAAKDNHKAANDEIGDLKKQIDLSKQRTAAKQKEAQQGAHQFGPHDNRSPQQLAAEQQKADDIAAQGAAEVAALERKVEAAMNSRAAATLNAARAAQGLAAMTGKAAQQAGLLARKNPNVAQNIAVKFTNPTNAGAVSGAARKALGAGVSVKTVLKIVADSKDAEAALRRLRTIEVNKKMLKVGITGDDGVLSKLSAIDRKDIKAKIARIIEKGGDPTIMKILDIIRMQIRDKGFKVNAAVSAAIAKILQVGGALDRLHDKNVTVTTNLVTNRINHLLNTTSGSPSGGGAARPGNASGRGPGATERSLIGEGGGPEHYIDPARGISFKTSGPMLMDLSPTAYVVPTEAMYKSRGRELLMAAAKDLGISMYSGGKHKKKKGGHPFKKLKIERGGSLKTDYFVTRQQETQSAYNRNATRYNNAHKQMGAAHDRLRKAQENDHHHHTHATGQAVKNASKAYKDARKEFNVAKAAAPKLEKIRKEAQAAYTLYATDQNKVEQYTNEMNTAATKYNATGDPQFLQAWNTAKTNRATPLGELVTMITNAKKTAGGKWKSDLNKMLSGAINDQTTAEQDAAPTGPDTAGPLSLEDFIQSLGRGGEETSLNTALSVAGLSADPGDDRTAGQGLVDFFTSIYGAAQQTGNQGLIGQAADALKGARDNLAGLLQPTQDESAISDQLRAQLANSQRVNAIQDSFIKTSLGPGDIGTAQYPNAGAAAANITIQTLHPADPATLDAIGKAATSGLNYQPSVASPRFSTGM